MGLFDSVRDAVGGDDGSDAGDGMAMPGEREPSPTAFRNSAVDAVDQWSDYGLDFSLDSLARLDSLATAQGPAIDVVREERGENAAAKRHMAYTIQAGSYLGETLARRCDGRWVQDGDTWSVRIAEGEAAFDVDIFDIAAHSFAEEPAFGEVRDRLDDRAEGNAAGDRSGPGASGGETADTTTDGSEEPPPDTDDIASHAEDLADVWEGYDLEFTPQSLARLDSLAATEWEDDRFADAEAGGDDIESGMFTKLLKQFGSYYGEVLVREHGGRWVRSEDTIAVRVAGDAGEATVARVFEVARTSLTGPPQFAADYNAVTDAADVYAPQVADHAAAIPGAGEGDETPADTTGPEVDRVGSADETADDTEGSEPEAAGDGETAGDEPTVAEAERAGEESEYEGEDGGADADEGDDGAFDVAAAARQVVGDDLGDEASDSDTGASGGRPDSPGATDRPDDCADTDGSDGSAGAGRAEREGRADPEEAQAAESEMTLELTDERDDGPARATPAALEDDAAAFAATWPGYDLDYEPASLERLDRLVATEYPDVADRDRAFRRARAAEVGGYLAAVLAAQFETEWVDQEADPALVVQGPSGRTRLDPVATAMARFRGEGRLVDAYRQVREDVGAGR